MFLMPSCPLGSPALPVPSYISDGRIHQFLFITFKLMDLKVIVITFRVIRYTLDRHILCCTFYLCSEEEFGVATEN